MVSSQLTYLRLYKEVNVYGDDKEHVSLRDREAFLPSEDSRYMGSLTIGRQVLVYSVHLNR